jgi:putative SOS response-associated peptidase YedK
VSLACQKAKDFGYPHELWTTRLLARHAREHGPATQSYTWAELIERYRLTQPARNLPPRYNIASTAIDVVRLGDTGPELVSMRRGLIPGWWKKTAKEVPSTFNARVETVAQKPMFRSAFRLTRCIVPASGYYEWRAV